MRVENGGIADGRLKNADWKASVGARILTRSGIYAGDTPAATGEFGSKIFAGGDTRRYIRRRNKFRLARQKDVAYDAAEITARDREATEQERNCYGRRKEVERIGRRGGAGGKGRSKQPRTLFSRRGGGPQPSIGGVVFQMRDDILRGGRLEMVHLLEVRRNEL